MWGCTVTLPSPWTMSCRKPRQATAIIVLLTYCLTLIQGRGQEFYSGGVMGRDSGEGRLNPSSIWRFEALPPPTLLKFCDIPRSNV